MPTFVLSAFGTLLKLCSQWVIPGTATSRLAATCTPEGVRAASSLSTEQIVPTGSKTNAKYFNDLGRF
jgi:hypothetical protein